jgi:prolipoprotein diacylglyceryltransferase
VPTAVIAFDFDPLLRFGNGAVRWETLAIAATLFLGLLAYGALARGLGLRPDDLLFVVLGIVPGAIIGGRFGYVLLHPAFFTAAPGRIIDPGIGSLELTLAVVGGAATGVLVGALLDGRPGRWLQAAAAPFLFVVAAGKFAMVLGGSGQGQPTTGEPATAYLGAGPWGSLGPEVPSIPSQVLEGLGAVAALIILLLLMTSSGLRRPDGRAFLVALAAWSIVRFGASLTWRDPIAVGPVRAEGAIDAAVLLGSLVLLVVVVSRSPGSEAADADRPRPAVDRASA